ncbi:LTA synthase family protein [Myxococcaceae bacterium GXIMD 01537]
MSVESPLPEPASPTGENLAAPAPGPLLQRLARRLWDSELAAYVLASAAVLALGRLRLLSRTAGASPTLLNTLWATSEDVLTVACLGLVFQLLPGTRARRWLCVAVSATLIFGILFLTRMGHPLTLGLLGQVGGVFEMRTSITSNTHGRAVLLFVGALVAFGAAWRLGHWGLARVPRLAVALTGAVVLAAAGLRLTLPAELGELTANPLTVSAFRWSHPERVLRSPLFQGLTPGPLAAPPAPSAKGARHNVLLIVVESLGAELLDDPLLPEVMPNMTRRLPSLHRHARHYAAFPFSSKSLYTLVCGDYPLPSQTTETRLMPGRPCGSWVEALRAEGYRGWAGHTGDFRYDRMGTFLQAHGFETLEDRATFERAGAYASNSWGVDDAALPEAFGRWLDTARPERFVALALPINSHHPWWTPRAEFERFDSAAYNAFHYQDALLEQYFQALEARGLLENTLVVITGDHGRRYAEHPVTTTLDEAEYRVPLWMHVPGEAPQVDEAPTSHLGLGAELLRRAQGEAGEAPTASRAPVYLLGTRTPVDAMLLFGDDAYYFQLGAERAYQGQRWVSDLGQPCAQDACREPRQALLDIFHHSLRALSEVAR